MKGRDTFVMALILAGCQNPADEVRGLHEQCVVCTSGSLYDCSTTTELECEPGLYCATASFRSCEPYAQIGEFCSFQYTCAPGLVCGHGETCEEPLPVGALCDARSFCIDGTTCNSGGVPTDPKAGTCDAPQAAAGAPCAWSAGPRGWTGRGCAEGLVCDPVASFDPAVVETTPGGCCAVCEQQGSDSGAGDLGDCLGWAGTCQTSGQGARGEACAAAAACASGICVVLPPPRVGEAAEVMALTSAWPGVCAGADDVISDPVCKTIGGCDLACDDHADCLPGTLCHPQYGRCYAQFQNKLGAFCGQRQVLESAADDRFCAAGLACDVDALTCRVAGVGVAGDTCADTMDCAGGFVCAGTCVPHGQVGDTCDALRRCDFDLRCSLVDDRCEVPGPLDQGGACESDSACGKGLYCEDARQTCQWLSREGERCDRCEPGLSCVTTATDTVGTCQRETAAP